MDHPTTDVELVPEKEKIEDGKEGCPAFHCDLYDTEVVHKVAQTFLTGLAAACVDNTTGGIFRSPASVAVEMRKEMIEYLTTRSENYVAESVILEGDPNTEVSDNPYDIISDFVDDFASSKRNFFSRVSGWLLSEKREDRVDDFVQEIGTNGFWLTDRRETIAQTLVKNVDFKNTSHCDKKFSTAEELNEHVVNCELRTMNCTNEGCIFVFCARHKEKHDSVCPFKIIPCEQECSESLMRREMDRHCITVCPMKLVNCPFYGVGCQSTVPRCMIQQHCSEQLQLHLTYALKSIHKEPPDWDLNKRVNQIIELSSGQLQGARDARSLTLSVKDLDAKLGPLEITPEEKAPKESSEPANDNTDKSSEPAKENTEKSTDRTIDNADKSAEPTSDKNVKPSEPESDKIDKSSEPGIGNADMSNGSAGDHANKSTEPVRDTTNKASKDAIDNTEKASEDAIDDKDKFTEPQIDNAGKSTQPPTDNALKYTEPEPSSDVVVEFGERAIDNTNKSVEPASDVSFEFKEHAIDNADKSTGHAMDNAEKASEDAITNPNKASEVVIDNTNKASEDAIDDKDKFTEPQIDNTDKSTQPPPDNALKYTEPEPSSDVVVDFGGGAIDNTNKSVEPASDVSIEFKEHAIDNADKSTGHVMDNAEKFTEHQSANDEKSTGPANDYGDKSSEPRSNSASMSSEPASCNTSKSTEPTSFNANKHIDPASDNIEYSNVPVSESLNKSADTAIENVDRSAILFEDRNNASEKPRNSVNKAGEEFIESSNLRAQVAEEAKLQAVDDRNLI